jgi:protein phosphatase 1L
MGKRPYMEDRHVVKGSLRGLRDTTFYAVFDGHAGSKAAEFCVNRLPAHLVYDAAFPSRPVAALTNAFLKTDEEFLDHAHAVPGKPLEDGTTAVAALVLGNRIWVANTGDSRCILVQQSGATFAMSVDHKPDRPDETRRIREAGGAVLFNGVWRVQGVLAVSRAIGDRMLKQFVTARPEVRLWTVNSAQDAFLVLATDGLWDVVTHAEAAQACLDADSAAAASKALVRLSLERDAMDNVTVLVVDLRKSYASSASHSAAAAPAAAGGAKEAPAAASVSPANTPTHDSQMPLGSASSSPGGGEGAAQRGRSDSERASSSGSEDASDAPRLASASGSVAASAVAATVGSSPSGIDSSIDSGDEDSEEGENEEVVSAENLPLRHAATRDGSQGGAAADEDISAAASSAISSGSASGLRQRRAAGGTVPAPLVGVGAHGAAESGPSHHGHPYLIPGSETVVGTDSPHVRLS